jgi:hypothetical protein
MFQLRREGLLLLLSPIVGWVLFAVIVFYLLLSSLRLERFIAAQLEAHRQTIAERASHLEEELRKQDAQSLEGYLRERRVARVLPTGEEYVIIARDGGVKSWTKKQIDELPEGERFKLLNEYSLLAIWYLD